ncbi:MAG: aminopeptidase [Candidatus Dormibacteraeota bacterium]|nr:aminopeptidase [Candidatus Dormibacteraeota bacterium]
MRQSLAAGARNAVRVCLNVGPTDRVAVIRDRPCLEIAEAIEEEARASGAELRSWTMEDHVRRPATEFPRSIADGILRFRPTASYFIGGGQKGELAFRQPMLQLLTNELGCRHGHMIGISDELMTDGMAGDYEEIYRITQQVWNVAKMASRIDVTTRNGTELSATFGKDRRWIPCDGRYWEQNRWGNLPEGETFTAPLSVDGVIAAEEMGDWFTAKYGLFAKPVLMRVKAGRLVSFETEDDQVKTDIDGYMAQHRDSNRVGEFAIGTNVGLTKIVGNFLQDEKFPGVHIAFGDPYGRETGADWECPSHVDVLASHATVTVDGRRIMEDGRFSI